MTTKTNENKIIIDCENKRIAGKCQAKDLRKQFEKLKDMLA